MSYYFMKIVATALNLSAAVETVPVDSGWGARADMTSPLERWDHAPVLSFSKISVSIICGFLFLFCHHCRFTGGCAEGTEIPCILPGSPPRGGCTHVITG